MLHCLDGSQILEAPMVTLIPRSRCSFDCSHILAFAVWLEEHSFCRIETHHALIEYGRWERNQRICIVYHSGAIVMVGKQIAPALALLDQLVPTAERIAGVVQR